MRKIYTTDLSDAEWACLKNHLPASKLPGKMRPHALREIFDAIFFYVLKSGCPWRLLPGDFPPWQTVFYHFRKFALSGLWFLVLKALSVRPRGSATAKRPQPFPAAIVDSQSVKTTEESAGRHKARMLTQTATTLISTSRAESATSAGRYSGTSVFGLSQPSRYPRQRVGARWLLAGLKPLVPRLKKIWVDGAYSGDPLSQWCQQEGGWELEVVDRNREVSGFEVIPKRWIVERTISWIGQNRRMSKDYERQVQTSETFIEVAMIRLILRRLARTA